MRPNAVESLGAIRTALAEVLGPELQSLFAQDTASTLQMLLESLSAGWDRAAADLHADNQTLARLLLDGREAFAALSNGDGASVVKIIDEALAAPEAESLAISALTARNNVLRAALEQVLMAVEDRAGEPGLDSLAPLRTAAYGHLREVAGRGWSFWDVASFREYMERYRTRGSQMTP